MRILFRAGMYSFSYPYKDFDNYKSIYFSLTRLIKDYSCVRVLLFENLQQENNFSRNAILNPNIYTTKRLFEVS